MLRIQSRWDVEVDPDDYDRFMDRVIAFKLSIRSLQSQIIERICIVDHVTGAWNRRALYHKNQKDESYTTLERVRETIATTLFGEASPFRITASLGLSFLTNDSSIESAILEADHALMGAKTAGRDMVCLWDIHGTETNS